MTSQSEEFLRRVRADAENLRLQLDVKHTRAGTVVLPTYKNALIYLNLNDNLRELFQYNIFCSHVDISRMPPWGSYGDYPNKVTDFDVLHLKTYLIDEYRVEFGTQTLNEAIDNYATQHAYDPVKKYLSGLKWDGKKRIDTWLTDYMMVTPSNYANQVGKLALVAACARVDKPGIKYDYMLILEGKQDIGKSLAVQILGGPYYREISLVDRTKETVEKMQGAWIIEVAELAVFKKKDIESLKAFITNATDEERLPYGRRSRSFPRRNILIGTINPDSAGYLSDETGNRRFLPVCCNDYIKLDELKKDRDQIWAEAWAEYQGGMKLFLRPQSEIAKEAKKEQEKRQTVDDWQDLIKAYLADKTRVRGIDIWTECLKGFPSDFDRFKQIRVANCMRRLGWYKTVIRINDRSHNGYVDPNAPDPLNPPEEPAIDPWDEEND